MQFNSTKQCDDADACKSHQRQSMSYLKQRNIILDKRTTIALEKEFWDVIDHLAKEDGWSNWRDWFYMNITKPENKPLSSQIRITLLKMALDR